MEKFIKGICAVMIISVTLLLLIFYCDYSVADDIDFHITEIVETEKIF